MTIWKTDGPVPRTGETSLSDDELIICDALLRYWDSAEMLGHEDFCSEFHLPYRPRAAGVDLRALVESMCERGIIQRRQRKRFGTSVSLAPAGGELWGVWELLISHGVTESLPGHPSPPPLFRDPGG